MGMVQVGSCGGVGHGVKVTSWVYSPPTSQEVAAAHDAALRPKSVEPAGGAGGETVDHDVPSQVSTEVDAPTAMQKSASGHETSVGVATELAIWVQDEPSKDSNPAGPAAMQDNAPEGHDTEVGVNSGESKLHEVPSQD